MAALPYGIFSFFLLEMQVDMGSVARLEIPKDAAAYCFGKSLDQLTFLSKKTPKKNLLTAHHMRAVHKVVTSFLFSCYFPRGACSRCSHAFQKN